jgi:hypothetical protein
MLSTDARNITANVFGLGEVPLLET